MTWVLVLVFLSGPLAEQGPFMLGTHMNGKPDRFTSQAACVKRIAEVGQRIEDAITSHPDTDIANSKHSLECRKVSLGSDT